MTSKVKRCGSTGSAESNGSRRGVRREWDGTGLCSCAFNFVDWPQLAGQEGEHQNWISQDHGCDYSQCDYPSTAEVFLNKTTKTVWSAKRIWDSDPKDGARQCYKVRAVEKHVCGMSWIEKSEDVEHTMQESLTKRSWCMPSRDGQGIAWPLSTIIRKSARKWYSII